LTKICLSYLNLDCFDPTISELCLRDYARNGFYSFEDYALQNWYNHVEESVVELETSKSEFLNHILTLLSDLFGRRWIRSINPSHAYTEKGSGALKSLRSLDTYDRLVHTANSTLLGAGNDGSTDDPLGFTTHIQRVRAYIESQYRSLDSKSSKDDFEVYYGPALYKCQRRNCFYFHEGFKDTTARDLHHKKHSRPFACAYRPCHLADIGIASARELRKHTCTFHGRMDDDPMEYPRRQQKKLTIFDAASQGSIEEAAKILQENPAIINSLTPTGQSLLHIAASKNQELFMSFLLDQGLSVNCVDRKGSTPLHGAAAKGHTNACCLLLGRGAVPNLKESLLGRTQIHVALLKGHEDLSEVLVAAGASIHIHDARGWTPLRYAVVSGSERAV